MKAHILDQVRRWSGVATLAGAVLLAGCGNDTSPTAAVAQTLDGVAATGAPIVGGTVNITCAGGSALSTTTGSNGAWTVTLSGQTLPCAVQVSGGNLPGGTVYHSLAVNVGTVNITPLTDLVLANAIGQAPATWFGGLNATQLQAITAQSMSNALAAVRTALNLSALNTVNPLTDTFTAVAGNAIDDILEALATALTNAGLSYATLLNNIYSNVALNVNFQNALASAWQASLSANVSIGTGSGGGAVTGTSCGSGGVLLTYSTSSAGGPFSNGQQVCFNISSTSLAFPGTSLGSPTVGVNVPPVAADIFFDIATLTTYEVVYLSGSFHEINILAGAPSTFVGQFQ